MPRKCSSNPNCSSSMKSVILASTTEDARRECSRSRLFCVRSFVRQHFLFQPARRRASSARFGMILAIRGALSAFCPIEPGSWRNVQFPRQVSRDCDATCLDSSQSCTTLQETSAVASSNSIHAQLRGAPLPGPPRLPGFNTRVRPTISSRGTWVCP
jgi:hypothetical protein